MNVLSVALEGILVGILTHGYTVNGERFSFWHCLPKYFPNSINIVARQRPTNSPGIFRVCKQIIPNNWTNRIVSIVLQKQKPFFF